MALTAARQQEDHKVRAAELQRGVPGHPKGSVT